jgi:hypothetical protein
MLHVGWKKIAELFGESTRTVRSYYYKYHMPLGRTPSGKPTMTDEMAAEWLNSFAKVKEAHKGARIIPHNFRKIASRLPEKAVR